MLEPRACCRSLKPPEPLRMRISQQGCSYSFILVVGHQAPLQSCECCRKQSSSNALCLSMCGSTAVGIAATCHTDCLTDLTLDAADLTCASRNKLNHVCSQQQSAGLTSPPCRVMSRCSRNTACSRSSILTLQCSVTQLFSNLFVRPGYLASARLSRLAASAAALPARHKRRQIFCAKGPSTQSGQDWSAVHSWSAVQSTSDDREAIGPTYHPHQNPRQTECDRPKCIL